MIPPSRSHTRSLFLLLLCVVVVTLAAAVVAGVAVALSLRGGDLSWIAAIGLGAAAAVGGVWGAVVLLRALRHDIQRLRGALLMADLRGGGFASHAGEIVRDRDLVALAATLDHALAVQGERRKLAELRLAAILEALPTGVMVVTDSGLVSVVNPAARRLFPDETVSPGTSVLAAIRPEGLPDSRSGGDGARKVTVRTLDGRELPASLGRMKDHGGWVYIFDGPADGAPLAGLDYDLDLHDSLPAAAPAAAETPLSSLPTLVLDCETTGVAPGEDRVISLGAVRTHGQRIFAQASLDTLVHPGVPIASASTKVHGIDNAMVADAPGFRACLADLTEMARGCVVVGHNVGFDIAFLTREAERAGAVWTPPFALDTGHLVAAMEPALERFDLDSLCRRFGVATGGRHTALGDALATAELFVRLIPLLRDRGVATLGDALRFSKRARSLRSQQKSAGWFLQG